MSMRIAETNWFEMHLWSLSRRLLLYFKMSLLFIFPFSHWECLQWCTTVFTVCNMLWRWARGTEMGSQWTWTRWNLPKINTWRELETCQNRFSSGDADVWQMKTDCKHKVILKQVNYRWLQLRQQEKRIKKKNQVKNKREHQPYDWRGRKALQ